MKPGPGPSSDRPPAEPPTGFDVRGRVVHGLRWTAVVRLSSQTLSWLVTLVVIRLLQPEDYGLHAMIGVSIYFLLLLSSAGIEQAIIQTRSLARDQLRSMFGVLLLVNLGLAGLQAALAPLLAAYYREPRVVPLLLVMSAGFLTVPFVCIPLALLGREMDFKHRSLSDLAKALTSSAVTLVLAWRGWGVWALVWGQLASMLAHAVALGLMRPWLCVPRLSLRGIGGLVRFGGIITASYVVWMLAWRSDAFLGGRILGPELLGVYAVALHLSSLPMEKLMPLLHEIAFPAYSRVQDRPEEVAWYYLKSVRLVSLVVTPVLFGLAAVAEWAIPWVLGERWTPAVLPVVLLSLVIPLRAIGTMNGPLLNGLGRAGVNLGNAVVTLLLLVPAFLIGMQYGVKGLCLAWLVAYPLIFAVISRNALRVVGVRWGAFAAALAPAWLAAAVMLVAVRAVGGLVLDGAAAWIVLCVTVPLGAAVYLGLLGAAFRGRLVEAVDLVRSRS